ncbi:MAG: hypothetical protein QM708_16470 [Propioniciclava sp.]|uniref:hypothetical protein n=1 Tax=Propioniciclava sp. TaxID=2038686 RepID=UPI0039E6A57F
MSTGPDQRRRLRLWWITGWFGPLAVLCILGATLLRWLPVQIPVPQLLTPGEALVPTALLIATPLGIAIQMTLTEPSPQVWAMATGYRRWLRHLRVLLLSSGFLLLTAVVAPDHLGPATVILLSMAGEAIVTGWILGYRLAWILPSVHAAAAALMGTKMMALAWWAWPADPNPNSSLMVLAPVILLAGLLIETRPR